MADPISFDPYLDWVDVVDPNNIPEGARVVSAADLLRYENLGQAVTARLNDTPGMAADLAPAIAADPVLAATYVRFEDEAGNPLPTRNVVIKVNATTGEIVDIVSEA